MSIEINQFNVHTDLVEKYRNVMNSFRAWHKIQIENVENLNRETVLKTIMKFVHPAAFIPVCYETSGDTSTFLLKNCGEAIFKLCNQNLIVPNPHNSTKPFKFTIFVNVTTTTEMTANVESNIMTVLKKRFHSDTGTLNLECFHKDAELKEFCPLCQPKLLFFILHLSKNFHIKCLKLGNNDIENLQPLRAVYIVKTLTSIDLRNNSISDISEITNLKEFNLTELWLDGNPLCDNYDEFTYGRELREVLPKLEKLDGVHVSRNGFVSFRRNFLCNATGHELVDQFLEHYFTLYDAQDRGFLNGVYHRSALFSMTCSYVALQVTSENAKLNAYQKYSRNIKQICDFSKNDEFLFHGFKNIIGVLCSLPASEHDPYTFTVDLMSYSEKCAVLVVTGVFRETAQSLLDSDRLLSFTRTFVLLAGQRGEYTIANEQLHVSNATTAQVTRAFKNTKIPRPRYIQIPQAQNTKEQVKLVEALKIVTGLNLEWSKKCLEESMYDFKQALILFTELFKVDKIPENAFVS